SVLAAPDLLPVPSLFLPVLPDLLVSYKNRSISPFPALPAGSATTQEDTSSPPPESLQPPESSSVFFCVSFSLHILSRFQRYHIFHRVIMRIIIPPVLFVFKYNPGTRRFLLQVGCHTENLRRSFPFPRLLQFFYGHIFCSRCLHQPIAQHFLLCHLISVS